MTGRSLLRSLSFGPTPLRVTRIDTGGDLTDEREYARIDLIGHRIHRLGGNADFGGTHELFHLTALLGEDERHDISLVARARGAA